MPTVGKVTFSVSLRRRGGSCLEESDQRRRGCAPCNLIEPQQQLDPDRVFGELAAWRAVTRLTNLTDYCHQSLAGGECSEGENEARELLSEGEGEESQRVLSVLNMCYV